VGAQFQHICPLCPLWFYTFHFVNHKGHNGSQMKQWELYISDQVRRDLWQVPQAHDFSFPALRRQLSCRRFISKHHGLIPLNPAGRNCLVPIA
jgi:hypothetical protein